MMTTTEACEFLHEKTGEPWTLSRLIRHGLKPYFWFDYDPAIPQAASIFNDHHEGFLAPLLRKGDRSGPACGATDVCLTLTRTHDDKLVDLKPAHRFSIDKLRFATTDIQRLHYGLPKKIVSDATPSAAKVEVKPVATTSDNPPGKMPQTAIGKLAVKASFAIERDTSKQATAKQTIERLQSWVEYEPILAKVIPHGVIWVTSRGVEKPYDVQTCAVALKKWNASRT